VTYSKSTVDRLVTLTFVWLIKSLIFVWLIKSLNKWLIPSLLCCESQMDSFLFLCAVKAKWIRFFFEWIGLCRVLKGFCCVCRPTARSKGLFCALNFFFVCVQTKWIILSLSNLCTMAITLASRSSKINIYLYIYLCIWANRFSLWDSLFICVKYIFIYINIYLFLFIFYGQTGSRFETLSLFVFM